jgi:uncharacterized protein (DUF433 family)
MDWRERIVTNPDILVGKPTIKGTRISVELILGWLAQGWTHEQVLENYPTSRVKTSWLRWRSPPRCCAKSSTP